MSKPTWPTKAAEFPGACTCVTPVRVHETQGRLACGNCAGWLESENVRLTDLDRFRYWLLGQIDDFCASRGTTIEEARGADVIAELIKGYSTPTHTTPASA